MCRICDQLNKNQSVMQTHVGLKKQKVPFDFVVLYAMNKGFMIIYDKFPGTVLCPGLTYCQKYVVMKVS